jgi:hypothetical protein
VDNLKEEIEHYKNKYKVMTVQSTTIKGREKHGLKGNIIDIKNITRKDEKTKKAKQKMN